METFDADQITAAPPEVDIVAMALADEPATDKAYRTANGTLLRARIVPIAWTESRAPARDGTAIAPIGVTLSLTVALLDETMAVQRDAAGALLISDVHEIVWGDPALANPGFDPEATLLAAVRQQAAALEARMRNRTAAGAALAAWGGALVRETPA